MMCAHELLPYERAPPPDAMDDHAIPHNTLNRFPQTHTNWMRHTDKHCAAQRAVLYDATCERDLPWARVGNGFLSSNDQTREESEDLPEWATPEWAGQGGARLAAGRVQR